MNLEKENDLLEILAEFDHEMLLSEESISTTRVQRWARNFVSYDKLSEKEKEKNRVLARRVLRLIQEYLEEER